MSDSSNSNRGRSGFRGQGGFRGMSRGRFSTPKFFSSDVQQEAAEKLEQTKVEVKKDIETAQAPDVKKKSWRNKAKVEKIVDIGKGFASKFFQGFQEKKRANIEVDMATDLDMRISSGYEDRMKLYTKTLKNSNDDKEFLWHRFTGIVDIAIAIKLYASAPASSKNHLGEMHSIHHPEIRLPKKLTVMIDQIGKSDISGDMRLRIRNQHLWAKKYMFIGAMRFFSKEHKDGDEMLVLKSPWTVDTVINLLVDPVKGERLYDENSLDIVKKWAKEHFIDVGNKTSYPLLIDTNVTAQVRVPQFDFTKKVKPADVLTYLINPLFRKVTAKEGMGQLIAALVIQTAQPSWIRNKSKKLFQLNDAYKDTFLGDVPFADMLEWMNMTDIGDIIEDKDLDNAVTRSLEMYNNGYQPTLAHLMQFESVHFADHGTAAQMIEIPKEDFDEVENVWDFKFQSLVARPKAATKLKIPEHDAILGVMVGYTKNLTLSTGFDLAYDSNVRNMMSEFVSSDFKAN